MKVIATTVGRQGPDSENWETWNIKRLDAASQSVEKAARLGANVIVLPAGFFYAPSIKVRDAMSGSLISVAKQLGIAIVFGVDQQLKNPSEDYKREIKNGKLLLYAYAWSPTDTDSPKCWNQRSTNSNNQRDAPEKLCSEVWQLSIRDENLGVLMCGEIFNERIRDALTKHYPRPKVVADLAHIGSRFRVWQGMKTLSARGLASLCSVHAQCEYAVKYCYVPGKGRVSSRIPDTCVYEPLRIELKLWSF